MKSELKAPLSTSATSTGMPTIVSGSDFGDKHGLDVAIIGSAMSSNVLRAQTFSASTQAAVTFGTALTATAVTLTLYNPAASGKNLVLLSCSASLVTCTTAGQVVYAVNTNTAASAPSVTTAIASGIRNSFLGNAATGVGLVYTAATLPAAPVAHRVLFTAPTTAPVSPLMINDNVDGQIVLSPNTAVTIQGITIVGTGIIGLTWAEVSV